MCVLFTYKKIVANVLFQWQNNRILTFSFNLYFILNLYSAYISLVIILKSQSAFKYFSLLHSQVKPSSKVYVHIFMLFGNESFPLICFLDYWSVITQLSDGIFNWTASYSASEFLLGYHPADNGRCHCRTEC